MLPATYRAFEHACFLPCFIEAVSTRPHPPPSPPPSPSLLSQSLPAYLSVLSLPPGAYSLHLPFNDTVIRLSVVPPKPAGTQPRPLARAPVQAEGREGPSEPQHRQRHEQEDAQARSDDGLDGSCGDERVMVVRPPNQCYLWTPFPRTPLTLSFAIRRSPSPSLSPASPPTPFLLIQLHGFHRSLTRVHVTARALALPAEMDGEVGAGQAACEWEQERGGECEAGRVWVGGEAWRRGGVPARGLPDCHYGESRVIEEEVL